MAALVQGHSAPDDNDLGLLAKAWDYALEDVPIQHFEKLFQRAVKAKRDSYPLSAIDMLTEWDTLREDLVAYGQDYAATMDRQLESGHGSLGRMTPEEWKVRNNLPANWEPGQPYPPESPLYGKPVPEAHQMTGRCARCRGDGWLRIPADVRNQQMPQMVRCPDCG